MTTARPFDIRLVHLTSGRPFDSGVGHLTPARPFDSGSAVRPWLGHWTPARPVDPMSPRRRTTSCRQAKSGPPNRCCSGCSSASVCVCEGVGLPTLSSAGRALDQARHRGRLGGGARGEHGIQRVESLVCFIRLSCYFSQRATLSTPPTTTYYTTDDPLLTT